MDSFQIPQEQPLYPEPQIEQEAAPQEIVLSREQMLKELLDWCSNFVTKSEEWRRGSFEPDWLKWQRAVDCIYDPAIAAKKEKWQSKAVWPITASHLSNAVAQLFKTEVGPRPPLEVAATYEVTPQVPPGMDPALMPPVVDQGELVRDLIVREREKSSYEVERNKVLIDKGTYGSGFARMRFENRVEDRKIKVPQYEPISLMDPGSIKRHMMGQPQLIGYVDEVQPTVIYRGTKFEHISIWDFFPDPKSLTIQGAPCAYRYNITYGEIVQGAQEGYYLPEAVEALKGYASDEQTPVDRKQVEIERKIQDVRIERTEYGKNLECFELFAKLPKKWVYINGEPIDDPEKLVPAIVRFKKTVAVVSVIQNDSYDGEPQIYRDDYEVVPGRFYARGIPEMLKDVQLVSSETVNQRLDTGSVGLSQKFMGFEDNLVDHKDIDENRNFIRLKQKGLQDPDVSMVLQRVDMGSPDKASFVEPQEWERMAHQRTSITPTSLGTEDNTDTTLGAQQIQQGVTGDKLAYIGMVSEFDFQRKVNHAYYKLIYSNYGPEDYALALGPEKASQLELQTPEQIESSYRYVPKGIFEMENKAMRQARVGSLQQRYGMYPWFNTLGAAKSEIASVDEDESTFILPEAEAIQISVKAQEMAMGMAEQMAQQQAQAKPAKGPEKK